VLEAAQEALKLVEHLDPSPIYGDILLLSGWVLLRMGHLVEASHSFEKCLCARQYISEVLGVAQVFESFGVLYLHRGAYPDAYSAYEAALEKYTSMDGGVSQNGVRRCRLNMARIRSKESNPKEEIGFYRPSFTRDSDTLFFPMAASS